MPIFNNEITFIHIPKCGGLSIESFLQDKGYNMSLFTDRGSIFINGHTPQHCTYNELSELNLLTEKIFTIIRPEIDRVISEYFYLLEYRPDLSKLFNNFDEFLELFLDKNNSLLFDNHNLSNKDFLINKNGFIDEKIQIFNFFEYEKIEKFLDEYGLSSYHKNKIQKNYNLNKSQIEKIKNFYEN